MPRAGLDSDRVVEAAAQLVDTAGPERLSLHAVAQLLGVRSPSLYVHIEGLDDLRRRLATLAARQLGDALAPAAAGLARTDALTAMAQAYRGWALEHPGLYSLIEAGGPRAASEPSIERILELLLAVLRGYGLQGDQAIHAARSVRAALHGFVHLETRLGFGIPIDPQVSFDWMVAMLDRGLAGAAD